jgi:hypothetical protein
MASSRFTPPVGPPDRTVAQVHRPADLMPPRLRVLVLAAA